MSDESVAAQGSSPLASSAAGFERLDTLVRVTTIQSWVYLATIFAIGAAAAGFAIFYEVPTKVMGEGILLIENDTISLARAQATGRLVSLRVKLDDHVKRGQPIGEISQDDLRDSILEAESKLKDMVEENSELTLFEEHEKKTHEQAMDRLKEATNQGQVNAEDKLKIARRLANSADRLRERLIMNDQDLLESREKFYELRDDLNKANTKLAELELEGTKAENARQRAQIERKLKIKQLERKLELDREKMTRTSQVISQYSGQVVQILSARDELVHEGAPVVLLHSPKSELGYDDAAGPYDSIVFVPAGEGKKINTDDSVEVSPATVKREEHGFIRGKVVAISELPATKLAMESALQHPELVETFLKRYSPGVLLRVQVKLDEASAADLLRAGRASTGGKKNHFAWSSSSGLLQPLKTGTMCQAAIVVEKRKLISLVLPWTKTMVGAD